MTGWAKQAEPPFFCDRCQRERAEALITAVSVCVLIGGEGGAVCVPSLNGMFSSVVYIFQGCKGGLV